MSNRLFQQARDRVEYAESMLQQATTPEQLNIVTQEISKARNDLSSAFAQSSTAEKRQLGEIQEKLDQLEQSLPETR